MKLKLFGLIAVLSAFTLAGCQTSGSVQNIYDKDGNVVQTTDEDGMAMQIAYKMSAECSKAEIAKATSNQMMLGITPESFKGLSKDERQAYISSVMPMMIMGNALNNATAKQGNGCQDAMTAYYRFKGIEKQSNTALWSKGLGILGFIGGAAVIGNSVEGIVSSIAGSGGNYISGSRVNMDSGNNYSSPGANANASSSGEGLGQSNIFGNADTLYGGNQPRGTTTKFGDEAGNPTINYGSNSGDNAPVGQVGEIPPVAPVE